MADQKTLATRYLTALNNELGWDAAFLDDGDIRFAHGGLNFLIENNASDDPEYLHVFTMFGLRGILAESGLDVDRPDDRLVVERLAASVTKTTKGAKVVFHGEDALVFSVEAPVAGQDCMPKAEHLVAVLPRVVSMLHAAVRKFAEGLTLAGIELATTASEARE
jgi:hypothetical protein